MENKHTPGQWEIDTNEKYVSKYRIYETTTGANVGWFDPDAETIEQGEANARLIAAAPDLLEALKICQYQLQTWIESDAWSTDDENAYELAQSAINKATQQ